MRAIVGGCASYLLHVHEKITLKDIFAFLVLLWLLICLVLVAVVRIGSSSIWRNIYVFPTKGSTTFAAINIPDSMIARCHWAVVRLAFDDVYTVKWYVSWMIGPWGSERLTRYRRDMLDHVGHWKPVHKTVRYNKDREEYPCSRHHWVNGSKMGLACGTSIDSLSRKVTTVAHAHVVWVIGG